MLWADRWEVETGRNRVRFFYLSILILHQVRDHSQINTFRCMTNRCAVFTRLNTVTGWFHPNQANAFFFRLGSSLDASLVITIVGIRPLLPRGRQAPP